MRRLAQVPPIRVTAVNQAPIAARGTAVIYWMIAARRTRHNVALQHAVARAIELDRPLIVLEALRVGYQWASDRLHRFVLDGMADNARACTAAGVTYLPYVEPEPGAGSGLLLALARRAACVVTDELPGFFLPRMVAAAGARLPVRLEQVDGSGVLPLRATTQAYPTAVAFRRLLQRELLPHLMTPPAADPLHALPRRLRDADLPRGVPARWPAASAALLGGDAAALAALPIDHQVPPVPYRGGANAGAGVVDELIDDRLDRYHLRNQPDADSASGLSPYLHFGHVSAHHVVTRVLEREDWEPSRIAGASAGGRREGWWRASAGAEAFLDQLITWRELGAGFAFHRADHARWSSLPAWARATLDAHTTDPRPHLYSLAQLTAAATDDPIWNAAQTQLRRDGRIHNYLRMLWGKRVLEWTPDPRAALRALVALNDRWAVDGRDANSWSGIFWVFGRFDHPWPSRPIFGAVRAMSSRSTARKLRLAGYLARYAPTAAASSGPGPTRPRRGRGS